MEIKPVVGHCVVLCGAKYALCVLLQRHMTLCTQFSWLSWPEQKVYKITRSVLHELAYFICGIKKPQHSPCL